MYHDLIHDYFVNERTLAFLKNSKFLLYHLAQLPYCLRVLLESTVRHCNNISIENKHVQQILNWQTNAMPSSELPFLPGQVIMHDFS
jgi:aconitase A